MPLGFYRGDNERLVSVTSFIDYLFGIADEIDKWTLKQAILAVQKASKTQKLTQETAIEIGLGARSQKLDYARIRGTQVHQAIQNLHSGIPYELNEDDAGYYSAYFNWYKEHTIEPILEEFKVTNHQYGYAGRLDFYGKLDGQYVLLDFKTSNSVRWTYGLQLACYKKCLEDMGHRVDACYVVHIKPKKRGGTPRAELFEFKYPFSAVQQALTLFNLKLAHDPYVKWYERTDEAAVEAEKKTQPEVESPSPTEPGFVPSITVQGQLPETQDTSPSTPGIMRTLLAGLSPSYPNQEGIQLLETIGRASEFVADYTTSHKAIQPEAPADETSSRIEETQPDTPPLVSLASTLVPLEPGVVVTFPSTAKPRIVPDPLALPSGSDILEYPELEWSDEPDSPRTPHQKTA